MKKNSENVKLFAIGLGALLIAHYFLPFLPSRIPHSINDLGAWYSYSLFRSQEKPFRLVGIAVDEYSLDKMLQRWPWRRSVHAELLGVLNKENVRVAGFDFAFIGASENREDDALLEEALAAGPARVVLAYFFDPDEKAAVLPNEELRKLSYGLGMLNTPLDTDGKTRRLRNFVEFEGKRFYSFSVALCAAYRGQKLEEVAGSIPNAPDRTYAITYTLKPTDIITLSFYDVLTQMPALKEKFGNDFLRDALVVVYPKALILHDTYSTPLGAMPGGVIHLNGVSTILGNFFLKNTGSILILCLIISFLAIIYLLRAYGLFSGALSLAGILLLGFWLKVLVGLKGLTFDYAYLAGFAVTFFILGSLYRYISFYLQISRIKDKATVDPLRGLFTPRYFIYRLALEQKNIYLGKDLFLVFVSLNSLKNATEDLNLDLQQSIYRGLGSVLSAQGKYWSVYSADELVGVSFSSAKKIERRIRALQKNLLAFFKRKGFSLKVQCGYVRLKREYSVYRLLVEASVLLKKSSSEIIQFSENDFGITNDPAGKGVAQAAHLLEGLDQDIEERNRQLLSLIDNLRLEHAKTKEAFFQIITSLVNALEARDSYTEGHSERVSSYALSIAEKLGWPKDEMEKLRKAALLHDLGKIGIPDRILHKEGPLNEEEREAIRRHEIIGVKILEPLSELKDILPWILYHHEKWDGSGYPRGLSGDNIPFGAQIISLADVFDALSTGRDYKLAFSEEDTVREIVNCKGRSFNPRLVDIFLKIIPSLKKT